MITLYKIFPLFQNQYELLVSAHAYKQYSNGGKSILRFLFILSKIQIKI